MIWEKHLEKKPIRYVVRSEYFQFFKNLISFEAFDPEHEED